MLVVNHCWTQFSTCDLKGVLFCKKKKVLSKKVLTENTESLVLSSGTKKLNNPRQKKKKKNKIALTTAARRENSQNYITIKIDLDMLDLLSTTDNRYYRIRSLCNVTRTTAQGILSAVKVNLVCKLLSNTNLYLWLWQDTWRTYW